MSGYRGKMESFPTVGRFSPRRSSLVTSSPKLKDDLYRKVLSKKNDSNTDETKLAAEIGSSLLEYATELEKDLELAKDEILNLEKELAEFEARNLDLQAQLAKTTAGYEQLANRSSNLEVLAQEAKEDKKFFEDKLKRLELEIKTLREENDNLLVNMNQKDSLPRKDEKREMILDLKRENSELLKLVEDYNFQLQLMNKKQVKVSSNDISQSETQENEIRRLKGEIASLNCKNESLQNDLMETMKILNEYQSKSEENLKNQSTIDLAAEISHEKAESIELKDSNFTLYQQNEKLQCRINRTTSFIGLKNIKIHIPVQTFLQSQNLSSIKKLKIPKQSKETKTEQSNKKIENDNDSIKPLSINKNEKDKKTLMKNTEIRKETLSNLFVETPSPSKSEPYLERVSDETSGINGRKLSKFTNDARKNSHKIETSVESDGIFPPYNSDMMLSGKKQTNQNSSKITSDEFFNPALKSPTKSSHVEERKFSIGLPTPLQMLYRQEEEEIKNQEFTVVSLKDMTKHKEDLNSTAASPKEDIATSPVEMFCYQEDNEIKNQEFTVVSLKNMTKHKEDLAINIPVSQKKEEIAITPVEKLSHPDDEEVENQEFTVVSLRNMTKHKEDLTTFSNQDAEKVITTPIEMLSEQEDIETDKKEFTVVSLKNMTKHKEDLTNIPTSLKGDIATSPVEMLSRADDYEADVKGFTVVSFKNMTKHKDELTDIPVPEFVKETGKIATTPIEMLSQTEDPEAEKQDFTVVSLKNMRKYKENTLNDVPVYTKGETENIATTPVEMLSRPDYNEIGSREFTVVPLRDLRKQKDREDSTSNSLVPEKKTEKDSSRKEVKKEKIEKPYLEETENDQEVQLRHSRSLAIRKKSRRGSTKLEDEDQEETNLSPVTVEERFDQRQSLPNDSDINFKVLNKSQMPQLDPDDVLTPLMIGSWMYRCPRSQSEKFLSSPNISLSKLHRRYFWVNPFSNSLFWAEGDISEVKKTKHGNFISNYKVGIRSVRIEEREYANLSKSKIFTGNMLKIIVIITKKEELILLIPEDDNICEIWSKVKWRFLFVRVFLNL